ncbi:MATE family efflux transporter [Marinomonas sp.]|uniref:MATE family efflux transporter n=1 Tax=Marinomonas sp. TaxID=1904862 RepID=UPI003BAAD500
MSIQAYSREVTPLLRLASPLILTQLAQVAISTTDIIMMGMLDEISLAAGGLALFLFNLLRTMGFGMVVGLSNMVAESMGESKDSSMIECLFAGLAVSTVTAIIAALIMIAAPAYLPWLGQAQDVAVQTGQYLLWMAPGMLPAFWFYAYRGIASGTQKAGILFWITLVSVAVNAGLNWVLIKGLLGFPALGLSGIAAASSLVFFLSFVALAIFTHKTIDLGVIRFRLDMIKQDIVRLLKIGVPTSASYGSEAGFFVVLSLLVGTFGAQALAAHVLVNQLIYIVFMISIGLSHASSIRISEAIGAKQLERQPLIARSAILTGIVCMLAFSTVYWLFPEQVLHLLIIKNGPQSVEVIQIATQLLLVASVMQCFDCMQNIAIGCMRSIGKASAGFWLTLVGYWGIGLPSAWVMSDWQRDVTGVWIGLMVGVMATAFLLITAFEIYSRRSLKANTVVQIV